MSVYDKIIEKHPDLFGKPPFDMRHTLIGFGFECGDGWYSILEETFEKMQDVVDTKGISIRVVQVKEKFGSLRIYYDGVDEDIGDIVNKAEEMTMNTCEICGKPGSLKTSGWMTVVCPEHSKS